MQSYILSPKVELTKTVDLQHIKLFKVEHKIILSTLNKSVNEFLNQYAEGYKLKIIFTDNRWYVIPVEHEGNNCIFNCVLSFRYYSSFTCLDDYDLNSFILEYDTVEALHGSFNINIKTFNFKITTVNLGQKETIRALVIGV